MVKVLKRITSLSLLILLTILFNCSGQKDKEINFQYFDNSHWILETNYMGKPLILGLSFFPGNRYQVHSDKGYVAFGGEYFLKDNSIELLNPKAVGISDLSTKIEIYTFLFEPGPPLFKVNKGNKKLPDLLILLKNSPEVFSRIKEEADPDYKGINFTNRLPGNEINPDFSLQRLSKHGKEINLENFRTLDTGEIIQNHIWSIKSINNNNYNRGFPYVLILGEYQYSVSTQHAFFWQAGYTIEENQIVLEFPPAVGPLYNYDSIVQMLDLFFPIEEKQNNRRKEKCVLQLERSINLFRMCELRIPDNNQIYFQSQFFTPESYTEGEINGIKAKKVSYSLYTTDYTPVFLFPDNTGQRMDIDPIQEFAIQEYQLKDYKNRPVSTELYPYTLVRVIAESIAENNDKWYLVIYLTGISGPGSGDLAYCWIQPDKPYIFDKNNKPGNKDFPVIDPDYQKKYIDFLLKKGLIEKINP